MTRNRLNLNSLLKIVLKDKHKNNVFFESSKFSTLKASKTFIRYKSDALKFI